MLGDLVTSRGQAHAWPQRIARETRENIMELPEWYAQVVADEAAMDGRIVEQADRIRERAWLASAACNHFTSMSYAPMAGCDECWDHVYDPRGDDGSGNRYPVRQAQLVSLPCEQHGTPLCMSPACAGLSGSGITVPAALVVETPERYEIPCLGDES